MESRKPGHYVVIGASWGGISALRRLAAALPPDFGATILVAQHIGAQPSQLAEMLDRAGPLDAVWATQGARMLPGTIYVAPPDRHLLVEGNHLRLSAGPKENHARPAIDPLLRSAAIAHRARCIGVILTGSLDDGTAGLDAVKRCGGTAVVQDPADAEQAEMPRSAIESVYVDHIVPLDDIAPLLSALVSRTVPESSMDVPSVDIPQTVLQEAEMLKGDRIMNRLAALASLRRLPVRTAAGRYSRCGRRRRCAIDVIRDMRTRCEAWPPPRAKTRRPPCGRPCGRWAKGK
ncbi:chemotaxis protein CheB [Achromobacter aloeverae]|uniref:chemotaxis protein CheB n=1 Tax=Achromobacter aloeverae TaxID=1750518 RepID=UPI0013015DF3|nr:chemotaxis protein CheB [Achromobacter aloeverae]